MKCYQGRRTIDGIMVTVDGKPLDTRYDLEQFTDLGFEWSYEGDSPANWPWLCLQTAWEMTTPETSRPNL